MNDTPGASNAASSSGCIATPLPRARNLFREEVSSRRSGLICGVSEFRMILGEQLLSTPSTLDDARMAWELYELQKEEHELQQMLYLQELENQELILQGLLNEKRALELAEVAAAKLAEASNPTTAKDTKQGMLKDAAAASGYGDWVANKYPWWLLTK